GGAFAARGWRRSSRPCGPTPGSRPPWRLECPHPGRSQSPPGPSSRLPARRPSCEAEAKFVAALERDGPQTDRVGRLLILTVEEIEILEHLAIIHSPEDVITDYAGFIAANPKDRAGSFRSFIASRGYGADMGKTVDGRGVLQARARRDRRR